MIQMFLTWSEISELMDEIEEADHAAIVAVFRRFRDMPLDEHHTNGVRKTVNINTFCHQFRINRQTFRRWLTNQELTELRQNAS